MPRVVDSSSGWRQMAELLGEETGLPMMICLKCSRERVREAWSQKENLNIGRVYMKCPSCGDFKWQRRYLDDLIKAKKVQLRLDDQDGIQEVQSVEEIHVAGSSVAM
ncbi:hypothetical protein PVAP13_3KG382400 [Panicum virgatum]|uniref:Uncharacterized protein n=1 Tax=Panicum virgatum TaxID=38727 RepID=A0A8T0V1N3_PANVG|nr:hypothetical protein PVAP13_3KG382400 [Panicum virgatum]